METASTTSSSALDGALVVLAVAQHAKVGALAAVGVDRDPGQDLLALLEAEPLHVEVREADAPGGVRRILAIVGGHGLREALEVLGDLAGVRHPWRSVAAACQLVFTSPTRFPSGSLNSAMLGPLGTSIGGCTVLPPAALTASSVACKSSTST